MKKYYFLVLLSTISISFLFITCNKEPDDPAAIPMFATINGELFEFNQPRGYFNTEEISINIQSNRNIYNGSIGAPEIEILDIPDTAVVGDIFPIVEFGRPDLYFNSRNSVPYFASSGTVEIISHDKTNNTMEIKFKCTLKEVFDESHSISLVNGSATFDYKSIFPQ